MAITNLIFDLIFATSGWAVGQILFNNFEKHLGWGERLRKLGVILVVLGLVDFFLGRWLFYGLLGAMILGMTVLHGWYFPKHGVNGLTAEPYDAYLKLIGR
jgi:hypothetical protein